MALHLVSAKMLASAVALLTSASLAGLVSAMHEARRRLRELSRKDVPLSERLRPLTDLMALGVTFSAFVFFAVCLLLDAPIFG